MVDRADVVLLVIPLFGVSGIVLRTMILWTGVARGLLAAPLAPVGFVAAAGVVAWELLAGPVTGTDGRDEDDSTGLFGRWR